MNLGNMSQKDDWHVSGARLLCEKGSAPKKICLNQDKHFTLLGFTTLMGEPAMCTVIFAGANQNPYTKVGVDLTKEHIRDAEDPYCFENKFGDGKVLLGSPACMFKGGGLCLILLASRKREALHPQF